MRVSVLGRGFQSIDTSVEPWSESSGGQHQGHYISLPNHQINEGLRVLYIHRIAATVNVQLLIVCTWPSKRPARKARKCEHTQATRVALRDRGNIDFRRRTNLSHGENRLPPSIGNECYGDVSIIHGELLQSNWGDGPSWRTSLNYYLR